MEKFQGKNLSPIDIITFKENAEVECKSCLKILPEKSFVHHLVKKDICRSAYGEEFIENWKKIIARQSKKNYKEKNKEAIRKQNSEYFAHYYETNKPKIMKGRAEKEEMKRVRAIEDEEKRLITQSKDYEEKARVDNLFNKGNKETYLRRAIEQFQEEGLSEELNVKFFEFDREIEALYKKFEKNIDEAVHRLSVPWPGKPFKFQYDRMRYVWNSLVPVEQEGPHLIYQSWHDMALKYDIAIKKVAERIGHEYEYVFDCTCPKCEAARKEETN